MYSIVSFVTPPFRGVVAGLGERRNLHKSSVRTPREASTKRASPLWGTPWGSPYLKITPGLGEVTLQKQKPFKKIPPQPTHNLAEAAKKAENGKVLSLLRCELANLLKGALFSKQDEESA